MAIALVVVSVVLVALSLYGVLLPSRLVALVRGFMSAGLGLWFAVAVRLLLAALLWFTAPDSLTAVLFQALAVFTVLAAIALPIVGRNRINRLIESVAAWPGWAIRLTCMLGAGLGGLLLWSIAPAIGMV
jgi:hypothetical protein